MNPFFGRIRASIVKVNKFYLLLDRKEKIA